MPDGTSTPIEALKPSETQTATPLSPVSSKRSISYWKSQINQRVASNIMASMRFGTDATARVPRDMRHSAVKELKLEQKVLINSGTELMNKEPYQNERRRMLGAIDRDISTPTVEGIHLDIDNFGIFNKQFGDTIGDEVLLNVGRTINSTKRETDIAGRVGGEEIDITAPQTVNPTRPQPEEPVLLAEKIRLAIKQAKSPTGKQVTVSIGTTKYIRGEGETSYRNRLEAAQIAAKRFGKDRVVEATVDDQGAVYRDVSTNIRYRAEYDQEGKILGFTPIN